MVFFPENIFWPAIYLLSLSDQSSAKVIQKIQKFIVGSSLQFQLFICASSQYSTYLKNQNQIERQRIFLISFLKISQLKAITRFRSRLVPDSNIISYIQSYIGWIETYQKFRMLINILELQFPSIKMIMLLDNSESAVYCDDSYGTSYQVSQRPFESSKS